MTAAPVPPFLVATAADTPSRKTFDAFQRWYTNPAKRLRNEWPKELMESDLEEIAALVPRFLHPDVSGLVLANALGVLLAHLAKERNARLEASNRQVQRQQDLERTITGLRINLGAAEAALGRRTMELKDAQLCEVYRRRRAETRVAELESQCGDQVTLMHAAADELERLWVEHGTGEALTKLVMRLRLAETA